MSHGININDHTTVNSALDPPKCAQDIDVPFVSLTSTYDIYTLLNIYRIDLLRDGGSGGHAGEAILKKRNGTSVCRMTPPPDVSVCVLLKSLKKGIKFYNTTAKRISRRDHLGLGNLV